MRPAVTLRPAAQALRIRPAQAEDIASLNGIIERAIATWKLPERVKRLSLPSYRYHVLDLAHLHIVVAEDADEVLVGVAAWAPANPRDLPAGRRGLLLHGLYADPVHHNRGAGSRLLAAAEAAARAQEFDGVLVKAQADAVPFFESRGLQHLPVADPLRDYPHRFWLTARD